MKKVFLLLAMLCVFVLTACGGEKADSKSKSKVIEASVEGGDFILSSKDGEFDPDGNTGLIKLDVQIKNLTKESIDIFPEMDMHLYDEDEQIDAVSVFDAAIDLDQSSSTSIGSDKQKTFTVFFDVEKDKEYELSIEPNIFTQNDKSDPVTLNIDMNDYSDSYDTLGEPIEVLEAYIDTIYFGEKEEQLEEWMDIDVDAQIKEAKKSFVQFLNDALYADVSSKIAGKYYETFIETLQDKGEFEVELKGNSGERAILSIEYTAISAMDVGEDFSDLRKSFLDKSDTYDAQAADEYALSKLDAIISKVKPREGRSTIEVEMVKKDDKWSFDNKYGDAVKDMNDIFAAGKIY